MKLIDKAAVVAEIENRIDKCNTKKRSCPANTQVEAICDNKICTYKEILSLLDTLEVKKEVDLEKDVKQYLKDNFTSVEEPDEFLTTLMQLDDMVSFAKHFYKRGMQIDCSITATDRGMAEEIIINLKRVEKDYRIALTKEIEWLRNKTKKGGKA